MGNSLWNPKMDYMPPHERIWEYVTGISREDIVADIQSIMAIQEEILSIVPTTPEEETKKVRRANQAHRVIEALRHYHSWLGERVVNNQGNIDRVLVENQGGE